MSIQFVLNNIRTCIPNPIPADLYEEVDKKLSYRLKGYYYSNHYKSGKWDGRVRLLYRPNRSFPSGLLPTVINILKTRNQPYEIIDKRLRPQLPFGELLLKNVTLRDYQTEAVQAGIHATRGVFDMATNSGKTLVACGITKMLRGLRTVFLTHKKDLLYQTKKVFEKTLGIPIGIIGDGLWDEQDVTIGMVQTLCRGLDTEEVKGLLKRIQIIFADECHHLSATTWYKLIQRCPAYYRFGLSGTPLLRGDGRNILLVGATGGVIYKTSNAYLIEKGYSIQPEINFITVTGAETAKLLMSFPEMYTEGIVRNDLRNSEIVRRAQVFTAEERNVLILVRRTEHGTILRSKFRGYGLDAEFIHGKDTTETRLKIADEFRQGKRKILITSTIFDEGIDIEEISALIIASGGESAIKCFQRVGRGLRTGEFNTLKVIDFLDISDPYLLKHSNSRVKTYTKEKGFIVLKNGVKMADK